MADISKHKTQQRGKLQSPVSPESAESCRWPRFAVIYDKSESEARQRASYGGRVSEGVREGRRQKEGDRNSNSLLPPPVKYNSQPHSRLDNPRSLCMKTYYAGSCARARTIVQTIPTPPLAVALLFSVEHDKSNYTFKLRYTILSPSFSLLSSLGSTVSATFSYAPLLSATQSPPTRASVQVYSGS